ncbi:MAG: hypothetical protein AAFQ88_13665 [Pseudomonadota bacterium]
MTDVSFLGVLTEVYRVSGRGTVLIVENWQGNDLIGNRINVGHITSRITALEYPHGRAPTVIGLTIEDDIKEELLLLKGHHVSISV